MLILWGVDSRNVCPLIILIHWSEYIWLRTQMLDNNKCVKTARSIVDLDLSKENISPPSLSLSPDGLSRSLPRPEYRPAKYRY
jgi:hypothetical protein